MKNKNKYDLARVATLAMLVFSMLFLISGITYAIFKQFSRGSTENFIEAGMISFAYNENVSKDNGIYLEEAFPIPDSSGIFLQGVNEYFDFSVSAKSTIADVYYEVVVIKQLESTLPEDFVKVYLTTKSGNIERASSEVMDGTRVKTYPELKNSEISDGKVAYTGIVKESFEDYHQDFRLRIWITDEKEKNSVPYNTTFSLKVRVNAIEQ